MGWAGHGIDDKCIQNSSLKPIGIRQFRDGRIIITWMLVKQDMKVETGPKLLA